MPVHRFWALRRLIIPTLFLFASIGQGQDVQRLPGDPRVTVAAMLAAVRSGKGMEWGAALEALGRAPENFVAALPELDQEVRSADPNHRLRALLAISAIAHIGTVPSISGAVSDPIKAVREEAIFALSRSDGGTETALASLFHASADTTVIARHARYAINAITRGRSPKLSPTFLGELRQSLHSSSPTLRFAALWLVRRLDAPWRFSETRNLLRDSVPDIRELAVDALLEMWPASAAARPDLERLAREDPVPDVREAASDVLTTLGKPTMPGQPPVCSHRAVSELIPMEFVVAADSRSLRDDGRGPYRQGDRGVRSAQYYAYNLLLPFASGPEVPTIKTDSALRLPRMLSIDLSSPTPKVGDIPLGVITDSTARFHSFFMIDHRGTIWNIRDIPVGGRVASDRTEIRVLAAGRQYSLQFGPWALGQCKERYAEGGRLHGNGTTPVSIERVSENEYRISAPPGAIGRLWDLSNLTSPQDRGLYYFSFEVRLRQR